MCYLCLKLNVFLEKKISTTKYVESIDSKMRIKHMCTKNKNEK